MTTYPDGTKVYTPFPDYEVTDPPTGSNVTRTTYRLAGRMVALRVNDGATNKLYYPLTDHLGNVMALSDVDGNLVSGSDARYDPFGAFTTAPATNPGVSNHGFTGHLHNNTGVYAVQNVGLIYMNARYYMPEIGRFISADTIVPEAGNPQSFNRYAYTYNSPVNYTDPTGHMLTAGCDEGIGSCLSDPDTWGANFITRLIQHGTVDNPVGKFILHFFWSTIETLSAEEQGNIGIVEEVSQGAIDAGFNYVNRATKRLGVDPARAWELQSELGDAFVASIFLILDTTDNGLSPGQAGRYGNLRGRGRVGDDLVPHHIPQKALGYTSEADGGAIVMWSSEHIQTRTYGWRGALTVQQDVGRSFREVLAADIFDVRGIVGSRYNPGLLDLIQYYRDYFPWLMKK